ILVVKMEDREAKNMFSDALVEGINEVFAHIAHTPIYKAVVLTGYDTYFASGGTKEGLMAIQQGKAKFTDTKIYQLAMECKVPVIAAMQGHGIGGGWSLGMFADLILFSEESHYLSPYMNYGFTPGAGATFIFPYVIGYDLARTTLLTAQEYTGSELRGKGLLLPVLRRDQVYSAAMALAKQIAKHSRPSLLALKQQLTQHLHGQVEETYKLELSMHERTFVGQSETLTQINENFIQENNQPQKETKATEILIDQEFAKPSQNVGTLTVVTANLKKLLAQELQMQEHEIDEDTKFVDLGLDSITSVIWVRKINEKYKTSIEATKVYSYPTLATLSRYVKEEAEKLDALSKQPEYTKPITPVNTSLVNPSSDSEKLPVVTANLKKLLAQELQMQEHEIDEDTKFVDLGLDSITSVIWIRKINEKYKTSIEATKVYSYPNLTTLSRYVKEESDKLDTSSKKSDYIKPSVPANTPIITQSRKTTQPTVSKLVSLRNKQSLRIKSGTSTNFQTQPIAVIGMAGQFPEAKNIEEFWQNIAQGKNCVNEIPKKRWDINTYYREGNPVPGKSNSKWMGALEEYDMFDPLFFNISPTEAESMDPQQRIFLQACWHSIENAGYNAQALSGTKCGVFVGCGSGDYLHLSREHQISAQGFTGGSTSILAARISYFLNLQGPCLSIDTACSSSLVALATACESLISGSSDIALSGGVGIMSTPAMHIMNSQTGMLSIDGRCYAFDQRANGFVPGEGVGVVMLKRLSDAERDQDTILGVIQGWGINQDGKTNGITAPNAESQTRLEQEVYDRYQINPSDIQLIEAHGTGTKLGDPIEVSALKQSFQKYTQKKDYCALGSVKSNIGHCLWAAGIAGVIKLLLALKYKQLPPTINFEKLNEHISLKDSPFYVNNKLKEWNVLDNGRRQAAISAFGFSGTNAHLVIAEYQSQKKVKQDVSAIPQNAGYIIPLSAKTTDQLKQKVQDLLEFIRKEKQSLSLIDMAYTLQVGRESMEERLGFMVSSIGQLAEKLQAYIDGKQDIEDMYQGQAKRNKEGLRFISQDDDMKETIVEKWIAQNKLSKLLDLWIKGLELDWNKLYGEVKPERISLPVYPFAKERYWIETTDKVDQTFSVITAGLTVSSLHPLVHKNTSDFNQHCYTSTFTGEEFFLKDHQIKIDGITHQKVLPGVTYLEMARAAISLSSPLQLESNILVLHNTVWLKPVVVTNHKQVSIALFENDKDKRIDFEIYSLDKDAEGGLHDILHCQGQAEFIRKPLPAKIDIEQLKGQMRQGRLEAPNLYAMFTEAGFNYGPAHQGITSILLGENQLLAQLHLPSVIGNTNGNTNGYLLHPSLMDSALQATVGLIADLNHLPSKPSVPFVLETLRIVSACTKEMIAWVRYSRGSQPENKDEGRNISKLDIDLCDLEGNVCVQMEGFTSRVLGGEAKSVHHKTLSNSVGSNNDIKGNSSSFNEAFYLKLIESVLNNEVSIDDAVEIE
ncbi:MAG: polyketide synthase dehydratase domain-containing protein, partial [Bacteroidales bacterium]|nr:polyketide synthase dehydratase domain-containing protein [Bacteroidales bacterium]